MDRKRMAQRREGVSNRIPSCLSQVYVILAFSDTFETKFVLYSNSRADFSPSFKLTKMIPDFGGKVNMFPWIFMDMGRKVSVERVGLFPCTDFIIPYYEFYVNTISGILPDFFVRDEKE